MHFEFDPPKHQSMSWSAGRRYNFLRGRGRGWDRVLFNVVILNMVQREPIGQNAQRPAIVKCYSYS